MLQFIIKPNFSFLILAVLFLSSSMLIAQPFNDTPPPSNNAASAEGTDVPVITPTTESTAPANDLCEGALPILFDGTMSVDNSAAGQTGKPSFICAPNSSNIGDGVWYTFEGNGNIVDFEITNATENLEIGIYSGSCGDLTCLDGQDDYNSNDASVLDFQTEVGVTYYIYIGGWAAWDNNSGTYDFTITGLVPAPACELSGEMEITSYESGCEDGNDNRVVMVTFTGATTSTEYTIIQGGAFVIPKGMGLYQVVGYGTWSIEATSEGPTGCTVMMESSELVYVSDGSMEEESAMGAADGSATIEVTGGTAPYTVEWSDDTEGTIDESGGTHTVEDLALGYYEAVVTDDDGNTAKACIYVSRKPNNGGGRGRGRGRKAADVTELNTLMAQPNPFSDNTTIHFSLPEDAYATVNIFSLDGRQMDAIFEGQAVGGQDYTVELNASEWASGMYILHMTTESGFVAHERLLITK